MKNTKICNICGIEKNTNDFNSRKDSKDGLRNECKICNRIRINQYRKKNKEKVNKWNRETYYRNIESHKLTKKKYRDIHKEEQKNRAKKYRENNGKIIKKYYQDNREHLNKMALFRITQRRKNNKLFSIICSVRARVNGFLKNNNITKKNKTFEIVGCTPEFLKEYLENKFLDGMNWENYGKNGWHIDHIIPLSSANTKENIYKLCHYTNLQPLWAKDNISKSNKIL